jgi:hypothetical protein
MLMRLLIKCRFFLAMVFVVIFLQQNSVTSGNRLGTLAQIFNEIPLPEVSITLLPYMVFNVDRISAYNPVPRQTQGDPNVSSCGPNLQNQIAVSRDLFFDSKGRKHLCGVRVTVVTDRGEVFEDYVIWDTMNARFKNTVDIMFPHTNEDEAFEFGITSGVIYFYTH